jgi:hypothetical protein
MKHDRHTKLRALLARRDALNDEITEHMREHYPVGSQLDFVHDRGIRRTGEVVYEGSHYGISVTNIATGKRRHLSVEYIAD